MRRTILLSLFVLFAAGAAHDASAQHRGGAGFGSGRGRSGSGRARFVLPSAFDYGYSPYDLSAGYPNAPQPVFIIQQPPVAAQPPAPPVEPGHPVVTEYKWPAADAASSATNFDSEPQSFALVLKDGSTLSAVSVFAADDGLHYVDPDERHLRISISQVDRAATLKLNRARKLNLYLPAAQ
ncbi:MAG TPA: hypothetical protein VGF96_11790 [Terracidiphilus sp.]|jgi:hypothetical protein